MQTPPLYYMQNTFLIYTRKFALKYMHNQSLNYIMSLFFNLLPKPTPSLYREPYVKLFLKATTSVYLQFYSPILSFLFEKKTGFRHWLNIWKWAFVNVADVLSNGPYRFISNSTNLCLWKWLSRSYWFIINYILITMYHNSE